MTTPRIDIIHDQWGTVEGVKFHDNRLVPCGWEKEEQGTLKFYLQHEGWREKPQEWEEADQQYYHQWADNVGDTLQFERLRCVESYDLPKRWYHIWCDTDTPAYMEIEEWVQQYKKPYLAVERKKG